MRATRLTDQLEGVVLETPAEPEEIVDEKIKVTPNSPAAETDRPLLTMIIIILTSFCSGVLVGALIF